VHAPIDFYFDFSSPYGYFAAEVIEDLAGKYGRSVLWHPILLGVSIKTTGQASLSSIPMKGEYSVRDFARSARFLKLPYNHPKTFPIATQHAARAFLWANDRDPLHARRLAQDIYRAYFVEGRNIADLGMILELATQAGIERSALSEALNGGAIKERLKAEVELATSRGVFGSPFFIVEGEPFWGVDRLPQLERWLAEGSF
jgi:2-hydroxychromene-2-carboxylate isomerase